jgi:hypothetical protein
MKGRLTSAASFMTALTTGHAARGLSRPSNDLVLSIWLRKDKFLVAILLAVAFATVMPVRGRWPLAG